MTMSLPEIHPKELAYLRGNVPNHNAAAINHEDLANELLFRGGRAAHVIPEHGYFRLRTTEIEFPLT